MSPARLRALWLTTDWYFEEKAAQIYLGFLCARQWFKLIRHQLRHGESEQVIAQLAHAIKFSQFPQSVLNTMSNVHDYLHTHNEHIKYEQFKQLGLPLGSGMVESACKWLIQQRLYWSRYEVE